MGLIELKSDLATLNKVFINCASITRNLLSTTRIVKAKNAERICLPCDRLENFISTNRPFVVSTKSEIDRGLESFMARYSVELMQWLRMSDTVKIDCRKLSSLGEEIEFFYKASELWDDFLFGGDIIFSDLTDVSRLRRYNPTFSRFEALSIRLSREATEWNRKLRLGAR